MTAEHLHEERIRIARPTGIEPHGHRGAFVALGVLSIVAGIIAFVFPLAATLAAALLFGVLLLVTGVAQVIHVFGTEGWKGRAWMLVGGVLSVAVGLLIMLRPVAGALTLTLLLGIFFLIGGGIRAVMALGLRPERGWGLLLANGILGILLGVLVFSQWPEAAAWLLGIVLGVDLMFNGVWLISASSGVARRVTTA